VSAAHDSDELIEAVKKIRAAAERLGIVEGRSGK
jgi:hypothetical protein